MRCNFRVEKALSIMIHYELTILAIQEHTLWNRKLSSVPLTILVPKVPSIYCLMLHMPPTRLSPNHLPLSLKTRSFYVTSSSNAAIQKYEIEDPLHRQSSCLRIYLCCKMTFRATTRTRKEPSIPKSHRAYHPKPPMTPLLHENEAVPIVPHLLTKHWPRQTQPRDRPSCPLTLTACQSIQTLVPSRICAPVRLEIKGGENKEEPSKWKAKWCISEKRTAEHERTGLHYRPLYILY